MKKFTFIIVILLTTLTAPLMVQSAGIQQPAKKNFASDEFQFQNALYFFVTGDYVTSSKVSGELLKTAQFNRDKILLLNRLSDIVRLYSNREYPAFTTRPVSRDMPELLKLLDQLYKTGEFEESVSLSRQLGGDGAARYFEGMSLLRLNKIAESRAVLSTVPRDDNFFPYARISLVQLGVITQNLNGLEEELAGLLSHPAATEEMAEKIHVLLGQVLFEKGLYSDAINAFIKVPDTSPFYSEAVIGEAWSMVKMGSCEAAVMLLKELKPALFHNSAEQDAQIMHGYCYLKTGRTDEAVNHFQNVSRTAAENRSRLDRFINDKLSRIRYIYLLVGNDSLPSSEEERQYLSELRSSPEVSSLLKEHRLLQAMRISFEKKDKSLLQDITYLNNRTDGLKTLLVKTDNDIKKARNLLLYANERAAQNEKAFTSMDKSNLSFFTGMENTIHSRWQLTLKRSIKDEEKRLVRLILQEGAEALECLNSSASCPLVHFMRVDRSKENERSKDLQNVMGLIEMIGSDMASAQKGEMTIFEKSYIDLKNAIEKKIEKSRETASALEKLRGKIKTNIAAIESGLDESLTKLDEAVTRKFMEVRYDMDNFSARLTAGLDTVLKAESVSAGKTGSN